ncbi:alpha/beta hydrolase [Microbacterium sp. LWH3-1.2]|uniref:alpha/beta hydrolase n=1 Tax=Microbacterium sp. LWH3-1.2 TaxID=3135256 RepID=UPI0034396D6E
MSVMTWNFESRMLRGNTEITVILPDMPRTRTPAEHFAADRRHPVLWLLHGTFGDHTDWLRKTNIEVYAEERGLAVVMPSALNSDYSNWSGFSLGYHAYDYLTDELMPMIYGSLPVSAARENNFIAGLSMGGRGAMKFAVNHPDRFAAAAVLSAAPVDLSAIDEETLAGSDDFMMRRLRGQVENAGGLAAYRDSPDNTWALVERLAASGDLPRLFFAVGGDDLLADRLFPEFRAHAEGSGLDAEFWTSPGHDHEWRFWDAAIQRALDFFRLPMQESNRF